MIIAALDLGLKRIGAALCFDGKIVMPQTPILRKNRVQASQETDVFLEEWNVDTLVVGLPKGSSKDEMERRIRHFVSLLKYRGDVVFIDEDFSSYEAKESAKSVFKQKKDGKIDSMAAAVILNRYLDTLKKK
ncbi:MAG: Holliday junction resolvase RuvX [Campylobacteraceae bacterium]|nr:Holliday junction resolvase RuvX [Campylobacteraceae bacterium]